MRVRFNDDLSLQNAGRTVAAGGSCDWDEGDEWAEIKDVLVAQAGVMASSGTASTTVRNGQDADWWLDANSPVQFTGGMAEARVLGVVHRTDGATYDYPWSGAVRLY